MAAVSGQALQYFTEPWYKSFAEAKTLIVIVSIVLMKVLLWTHLNAAAHMEAKSKASYTVGERFRSAATMKALYGPNPLLERAVFQSTSSNQRKI